MVENQDDFDDFQETDEGFNELQRQQQHNTSKHGNKAPRIDSFVQRITITSSTYIRSKARDHTIGHLPSEGREIRTVREGAKNNNYQLVDRELENNELTIRNQEHQRI